MRGGWLRWAAALKVALALFGCSLPDRPEAPRYEVDIEIPVANEVVTMSEVVSRREDYLSVGPSGTIGIDVEQEIDRFEVGDNLRISPPETDFVVPVPAAVDSFTSKLDVDLADGIRVTRAQIRSGGLRFDLSNSTGRVLKVSVSLPDFTLQDREIVGSATVPPGAGELWIPLAGADFAPASPERLRYEPTVRTGESGSAGILTGKLQPEPILFERVEGSFSDLRVDFEASTNGVDFPGGQYAVALTAAAVDVQIANGIGAESRLDMTVIGRRGGSSVTLTIPPDQQDIVAGDPGDPSESTVRFDQSNSNILDFLNLIPTSIEISGGILIDDSDAQVARTDGMDLKVLFRAPLDLVLDETTILTDPRDIGVDDADVRQRLVTQLGASTITLGLTNHLPVEIGVRLLVDRDPAQLGPDPELVIPRQGEIVLLAAPVDPTTGIVVASVSPSTPHRIELTPEEIAVFSHYPLFSQVALRIAGTEGRRVQIVEGDFAEVTVRAKIRIRVDRDLVD